MINNWKKPNVFFFVSPNGSIQHRVNRDNANQLKNWSKFIIFVLIIKTLYFQSFGLFLQKHTKVFCPYLCNYTPNCNSLWVIRSQRVNLTSLVSWLTFSWNTVCQISLQVSTFLQNYVEKKNMASFLHRLFRR